MLLVALLVGELVLSGIIARRRFGAEPISESAEELASQEALFVGMTLAQDARQPRQGRSTRLDSQVA
jgi:hypothetical protein